jgi:putative tricarboxylic transport membrane protein
VRRRDLGAAAVLLAFGLFALTQARGLRFGTVAAPGPGFFPLCLAAALCLTSFALLVSALRAGPGDAAPSASRQPFMVTGTLASLLVYALVLERLGFLLATFALLVFFFGALQRQRWFVAVGGSLVTSVAAYVVFKLWLGVNLPGGLWSF